MSLQSSRAFELSPNDISRDRQTGIHGPDQQAMNPVHQAYLHFAFQQNQILPMQLQQSRMATLGPEDLKVRDLMSLQTTNYQDPATSSRNSSQLSSEGHQAGPSQRSGLKLQNQQVLGGIECQAFPGIIARAEQTSQNYILQDIGNNRILPTTQLQAMQAWGIDRGIDSSMLVNTNMVPQNLPIMQSRAPMHLNVSKLGSQSISLPNQRLASQAAETSQQINSQASVPVISGPIRQFPTPCAFISSLNPGAASDRNIASNNFHGSGSQIPPVQASSHVQGVPSGNVVHSLEHVSQNTNHYWTVSSSSHPEAPQMHQTGQSNQSSNRSSPTDGIPNDHIQLQGEQTSQTMNHIGFTKQQLHVLKAQILSFRRLKKGEYNLPHELLHAIVPPPLELPVQQQISAEGYPECNKDAEEQIRNLGLTGNDLFVTSLGRKNGPLMESYNQDEKPCDSPSTKVSCNGDFSNFTSPVRYDQEIEHIVQVTSERCEVATSAQNIGMAETLVNGAIQTKKPTDTNITSQSKDSESFRKYHGPLFDFPYFTRKNEFVGPTSTTNPNNNLVLAYDIKDLLYEESVEVIKTKRSENMKKIHDILSVNLERKRIKPDIALRLQIEEKKLRLLDLQARLRDEVEQQQREIMTMPDRPYRKFVRSCERQRLEWARQVQASQKAIKERRWKLIFQWRKKLLESHWAIRDARIARNRGIAKYHEKMLREFSKMQDDDRNKRMEALKNNDVERYREMLLEQQTSIPGEAAERYAVLSSFLTQTEEYLHKLGSKITAAKNQQDMEEAGNTAAVAARLQGLTEEEVRVATCCARDEVIIRNQFMEMNAPKDSSSVSKYYNLAHAVNEKVIRQPTMLRAGTLRDYQLVGLQWMLSLYNNKLNGILADEMGLGKTVQVMALIAHLMEYKGNYGPHLIIVPNAVLVNWKSELHDWLPSVSCIFYVGGKDHRSKLFSQGISSMKFNILVTTYEFIMYDRTKLSKVDWKYIIIDEAQRMKDRKSVLARDLDRYRCQRRLLLTGTPLQNDLKELWSLLNLLLPEVFDNQKAFHDWFSKPFQKEGVENDAEDDWLETEKKVIIIHRLHQILEPFMLRRRVEDVEGSLPPKVSIVLRCRMSAIQSAIYDWIKSTGSLRIDPEAERCKVQKNPFYQVKVYIPLKNKCMELRKACNHPLLNYPYFSDFSKDFLVKSCGKLWILDRILVKLQRTGHRVLLFSTMTRLLDILEEYLQWRGLAYRRIDGTTSLEDRESAIVDFNSPESQCFIFLLSIRAAGRGLNLQTADTVVIYDPDPNPQNEEQAVARAHRIGQTREVKVIYLEAVVDKTSCHQKDTSFDDDHGGTDRYMGSIESLIRNNIQQYKIDMADEVINAGRFDQRTTHEERRMTLETLLHDEERYQEMVHDVPSLQEVNRMIARSNEEVELFDQMDEEFDWANQMITHNEVPKWLKASAEEVNATIAHLSKKPSKRTTFPEKLIAESREMETDEKQGRPKRKNCPNYKEIDDEIEDYSETSSDGGNGYSAQEEELEIRELDEDECGGTPVEHTKYLSVDVPVTSVYSSNQTPSINRVDCVPKEVGSSGTSSGNEGILQVMSPISSQKFGYLSALDARHHSLANDQCEELEEGEISVLEDSQLSHSHPGYFVHDGGSGAHILQPKIKRKRSIRYRHHHVANKDKLVLEGHGLDCSLPLLSGHRQQVQKKVGTCMKLCNESDEHYQVPDDSSRNKTHNNRSHKTPDLFKSCSSQKLGRQLLSGAEDYIMEYSRESSDDKDACTSGSSLRVMPNAIQRRCKIAINRLQRRIQKEGQKIVPHLTDLWKGVECSGYSTGFSNDFVDLCEIEKRIDQLEYKDVMDFLVDVQDMLRAAMQIYGFHYEIRLEARKVHDLFFDILKITFPDTDFEAAKNALSFSNHTSGSASFGRNRREKATSEIDLCISSSYKRGHCLPSNDAETAPFEQKIPGSSSNSHQKNSSPVHPGELVTCKKKRKDREKTMAQSRIGLGIASTPNGAGYRATTQRSGFVSRDTMTLQHQPERGCTKDHMNDGVYASASWANPVKKLRTNVGRRRLG